MIQWYPGHMAKAIREIDEKIKLVDVVTVLLDARIPLSSFNPLLKEKIKNKPVLYLLTKKDMANPELTKKWLAYYQTQNTKALAINSKDYKNIKMVVKELETMMEEKRAKDTKRGLKARPIRTMVVGIPNVGKSTFINALVNKKVTNVGDKPGITKSQQWIRIHDSLELIDTPGVLWPKFEDERIGYRLAIIGSIRDEILKITDIAIYALEYLKEHYSKNLVRYECLNGQNLVELTGNEMLVLIGKHRKYYLNNGTIDLDRVARLVLQDIRNLNLGLITFEDPDDEDEIKTSDR